VIVFVLKDIFIVLIIRSKHIHLTYAYRNHSSDQKKRRKDLIIKNHSSDQKERKKDLMIKILKPFSVCFTTVSMIT
jgi:hypothetical protein